MVLYIVVVLDFGGITRQVFLNVRVATKKYFELRQAIMVWITIAPVRIAVEGIFLPHEGIRVLPYLVANSRVVLKVRFEGRMVPQEISIVQQGRIFANLFGNFTMTIEEPVETRHVSAVAISASVTIAHVRIAVVCIFLPHEGVRVLPYLVANSRVVLEVSLQGRMVPQKISIV